jgi:SAM-dependent methyltransferase
MKSTDEMIRLNKEQAKFYDSIQQAEEESGHGGYAHNEKANLFTRAWAGLRYRQQAAVRQAGIDEQMQAAHDRWIQGKAGGDFLEIGCFSGSPSTFKLAHAAGAYLGIELSPKAVATLNARLAAHGLAGKARAEAGDFLLMDETRKYDLVYAHGVLHHFENPEPLFAKLALLLKPEGRLLFVEPCAVNPAYRLIRALYRPFQSDAKWEWPFRDRTVAALERHFKVGEGFGWGCWSLPLSVLTGVPWVGPALTGLYIRLVRREISRGWHAGVWNNSMVTACYQLRSGRDQA